VQPSSINFCKVACVFFCSSYLAAQYFIVRAVKFSFVYDGTFSSCLRVAALFALVSTICDLYWCNVLQPVM
jgi:hypothetical protein